MLRHFNTFGYIVVKNFWSSSELQLMGEAFASLLTTVGLRAQFADRNHYLASLITLPKVTELIEHLFGDKWLYKGSDGNIFDKSTPWHRDYLIKTQTCKLLTYLDDNTLDVIPGSHHVGDNYCDRLGADLRGPESGGFHGDIDVPYQAITTNPGDIIVFNHCIIHRTFNNTVRRNRRLFGLHFSKEFNDEMKELTLIEMKTFNCEKCYGPYIPDNEHTHPYHQLINSNESGDFSG